MASPRKISRFTMSSNENEQCKTCKQILEEVKKSTENQQRENALFHENLQQENAVVRDQLNALAKILADQTVLLKQLLKEKAEINSVRDQFPIETEEQLIKMEENLKMNRDIYISTIKSILQPAGFLVNLKFILSDEIVLAYNVDGVQGKKALRSHSEFYGALLECIPPGDEAPEMLMRKAMQRVKKRVFKQRCTKPKNELESV
ncbi:uncharacterized protein LOC111072365 isoform X2 [Drosophila obscura]|uniref:uncharacterized protein LOC111072365 isoform X2 n=1 Tax=Drosophila obscura TaxID=7282 RepID=UPI001BB2BCA4|nr:uncharacterized protein LOC111072365 isoform X2 [Drosophila obscura]